MGGTIRGCMWDFLKAASTSLIGAWTWTLAGSSQHLPQVGSNMRPKPTHSSQQSLGVALVSLVCSAPLKREAISTVSFHMHATLRYAPSTCSTL